MKLNATITDIAIDNKTKHPRITLDIEGRIDPEIDELQGRLTVELKKYRKSRSLDANAYAWVLMDKLAAKTGIPKTEIYRNAVREIGGVSTVICVQNAAAQVLREAWESRGLGWQTDTMKSNLPGCTNVILYYGSSCYDTAQMTALLNFIIAECREQEIQTMTPNEIVQLAASWENAKHSAARHS